MEQPPTTGASSVLTPGELKDALKAYGQEVGLDRIGVAAATPFNTEKAILAQRQAIGLGPNPFEHPDLAERVYPDLLLPGAQSIIAAAMSYRMPDEAAAADSPPRGWLSRYCRGRDYHGVLEERLRRVADWLEERLPGIRTFVHVDTGAPLDRAVAERAGLGRMGKSTNLIVPGLGTWVFLGEIYTDAVLPPDAPSALRVCGSCTRCMDVCPTHCLQDWQIDANRCLGYVTQMDGIVPVEFRELMGNRLFGCDDCQDVCPFNARPLSGLHPEFAPLPGVSPEPDLAGVLAMDAEVFASTYGPTAASWRGPEPLQRNALIALGNTGDPSALAPLQATLAASSALLREHAAWGLGRLATLAPALAVTVRQALVERLEVEEEPSVQSEIELALERLLNPPGSELSTDL